MGWKLRIPVQVVTVWQELIQPKDLFLGTGFPEEYPTTSEQFFQVSPTRVFGPVTWSGSTQQVIEDDTGGGPTEQTPTYAWQEMDEVNIDWVQSSPTPDCGSDCMEFRATDVEEDYGFVRKQNESGGEHLWGRTKEVGIKFLWKDDWGPSGVVRMYCYKTGWSRGWNINVGEIPQDTWTWRIADQYDFNKVMGATTGLGARTTWRYYGFEFNDYPDLSSIFGTDVFLDCFKIYGWPEGWLSWKTDAGFSREIATDKYVSSPSSLKLTRASVAAGRYVEYFKNFNLTIDSTRLYTLKIKNYADSGDLYWRKIYFKEGLLWFIDSQTDTGAWNTHEILMSPNGRLAGGSQEFGFLMHDQKGQAATQSTWFDDLELYKGLYRQRTLHSKGFGNMDGYAWYHNITVGDKSYGLSSGQATSYMSGQMNNGSLSYIDLTGTDSFSDIKRFRFYTLTAQIKDNVSEHTIQTKREVGIKVNGTYVYPLRDLFLNRKDKRCTITVDITNEIVEGTNTWTVRHEANDATSNSSRIYIDDIYIEEWDLQEVSI